MRQPQEFISETAENEGKRDDTVSGFPSSCYMLVLSTSIIRHNSAKTSHSVSRANSLAHPKTVTGGAFPSTTGKTSNQAYMTIPPVPCRRNRKVRTARDIYQYYFEYR